MAPAATAANGTNGHHESLDFTTFRNTINGKLVDTREHRRGTNPGTGKPLHDVPVATEADVDEAVSAAREAFVAWKNTTREDRREYIQKFMKHVNSYTDDFARLLTAEQGKPLSMAKIELTVVNHFVDELTSLKVDDEVLEDSDKKKVTVRYYPLGVVGAIVPWNFPIILAMVKVAAALIMGNVVILKPSPFTPYCSLKLGEIAKDYFPPGVVQVLSGDDNLGPWLTSHPGIDKISFTGSSVTGKKVMASCAKTLKRVTLELGGNDPAIVCADVDIEKTAPKIAQLAFFNSGQVCLALKRIYIHESIFDKFRDAMIETVKTLKFGAGTEQGITHGPVQNRMQYDKVLNLFDALKTENQKVAYGGEIDRSQPGFFLPPTVVDRPAEDSKLVAEEQFGPIVPLLSWSSEEDVIARANDSRLGLGASVWSSDLNVAEKIARNLEAGNVWINQHFELNPAWPCSGAKESGLGVEYGKEGLKDFAQLQTLVINKA